MDSQVNASQHKFATCVRLAFRLATHLRGLALTLVELKFGRKFLPFGHPAQVDTS